VVRFADDFVIVLEHEADAQRVLKALHGRMNRFGLKLHPEKTRLVDFRRPDRMVEQKPGTFDLLGFTHFWDRSRTGSWVIRRKTAASRFRRTIRKIGEWCRVNRHRRVDEQHQHLTEALEGHDAYYGITGNWRALNEIRYQVGRIWRHWLNRRSHKARMTWEKFNRLLRRLPLPLARVVHSIYGRQLQLPGVVA
jgi:RNA-directed DNA polymerase